MYIEADDESLATGQAYDTLKRVVSDFSITSVRGQDE